MEHYKICKLLNDCAVSKFVTKFVFQVVNILGTKI